MTTLAMLEQHLGALGRVVLAYSGGVDSALLAVVARRTLPPGAFAAVIGRSASYPAAQYAQALRTARQFDIPLVELSTNELDDGRYQANAPDRCYYCKHELWSRVVEYAGQQGYDAVIDGTHAGDAGDHRPGMRAATEQGVHSPLLALGWTKASIRAAARDLGLDVWDAPASPCLASRIQYGVTVTAERLRQVETAESLLRDAGVVGDLRVRHRGDHASVEVGCETLPEVQQRWTELQQLLAPAGFDSIELDPLGYRRGSLLVTLTMTQVA